MTRTLAASAALTTLILYLQPAAAAEPPWCAVIQNSTESVTETANMIRLNNAGGLCWQAIAAGAMRTPISSRPLALIP
jgi:hypothetical protein